MANADFVKQLRERPDLWINPTAGADLARADLAGAQLAGVDLRMADLTCADLTGTDLRSADLTMADLTGATLSSASLVMANLTMADLTMAGLQHVDLVGANLSMASLVGAVFTGAKVGYTMFGDLDLSASIGLDQLLHAAPSTVGIDTLVRTGAKLPRQFLVGCGLPESFVDGVKALLIPASFSHFRAFLSYSTRDRVFGDKLYHSLFVDRGLTTWRNVHELLPSNAPEPLDRAINTATDRLVIVCSKDSLAGESAWWIAREVERALLREWNYQEDHGVRLSTLIPIAVDDFLNSSGCTFEYKATLIERRILDFTDWDANPGIYDARLGRLVEALRLDNSGMVGP